MTRIAFSVSLALLIIAILSPCGCSLAPAAASSLSGGDGIRFDATITLGNLLTILALFISLVAAYVNLRADMAAVKVKVELLWDQVHILQTTRGK